MKTVKFSRTREHRELMLRNLATSLVLYEKIKTTHAKAKAVKILVEKMITRAKKNDLSSSRKLQEFFTDVNAVKKIREELIKTFANRPSGFIRVARLGFRAGDSAPMSQVELIMPHKKAVKKEAETIVSKKGKVTIRTKTSGSKVEVAEKIAKTKKEKITKKPAIAIKTIQKTEGKKGWLDRVSDTGLGKKFSQATKKIWTKRTTSK